MEQGPEQSRPLFDVRISKQKGYPGTYFITTRT